MRGLPQNLVEVLRRQAMPTVDATRRSRDSGRRTQAPSQGSLHDVDHLTIYTNSPGMSPGEFVVLCGLRSCPCRFYFLSAVPPAGKFTRMVVPVPTVECSSILAPCSTAMCLTMASPSPVPPVALLRLLSTR